jgi:hypothetical protein
VHAHLYGAPQLIAALQRRWMHVQLQHRVSPVRRELRCQHRSCDVRRHDVHHAVYGTCQRDADV